MADKKENKGIFENLYSINVGEHLDLKGGFKYLKWSVAFRILLQHYPKSHWRVLKQDEIDIGVDLSSVKGSIVATEITVVGNAETVTRTEFLPVLDYRNNILPGPSTMDINSSIKRCYVKTLAHLGLGMKVFEGADYPEDCTEPNDAIVAPAVNAAIDRILDRPVVHDDIDDFIDEVGERINHEDQEELMELMDSLGLGVPDVMETIKEQGYTRSSEIPKGKLEEFKEALKAKGVANVGS